jgi:CheY-like chemotaxis protein
MNNHVLVVDDESVMRRLVAHVLKTINVEVVGAENGFRAIELAQECPPALAIVDLNLPGMNGFEVVKQLKQMPDMRDIPMIIFTARNHPDDEQTAREIGASGFLYKPFSTQELRDLIIHHIG